MVGLLQIVIYLLAVYLVYKGVEIFQIAFVADKSLPSRRDGIMIGVGAILFALLVGAAAVLMTERMAASIGDALQR